MAASASPSDCCGAATDSLDNVVFCALDDAFRSPVGRGAGLAALCSGVAKARPKLLRLAGLGEMPCELELELAMPKPFCLAGLGSAS